MGRQITRITVASCGSKLTIKTGFPGGGFCLHGPPPCGNPRCIVIVQDWDSLFQALKTARQYPLSSSSDGRDPKHGDGGRRPLHVHREPSPSLTGTNYPGFTSHASSSTAAARSLMGRFSPPDATYGPATPTASQRRDASRFARAGTDQVNLNSPRHSASPCHRRCSPAPTQ